MLNESPASAGVCAPTSAPWGRYTFAVRAETVVGEAVAIVGSIPELGSWDASKALRLHTRRETYPLWCTPGKVLVSERVQYKYIKVRADSGALICWERDGGPDRWVPVEEGDITVDDGGFGYVQPWPRGWRDGEDARAPLPRPLPSPAPGSSRIVIIGSSVAAGHACWLHRGWAHRLAEALRPAGHVVLNVSEPGAGVARTAERFPVDVAPLRPDVVVIALSLGNEDLAHCAPHQRAQAARTFDAGIAKLVSMARDLGARPVLGGVYPHGDYGPEHEHFLRQSRAAMLRLGVPVLDWLPALDDGAGRWKAGLAYDPAHPNQAGHEAMFAAVDLSLFSFQGAAGAAPGGGPVPDPAAAGPVTVFEDAAGFTVQACRREGALLIRNGSSFLYKLSPSWGDLQAALRASLGDGRMPAGLYAPRGSPHGSGASTPRLPRAASAAALFVEGDGSVPSELEVPPGAELRLAPVAGLFAPGESRVLFYDGSLGALLVADEPAAVGDGWPGAALRLFNESASAYNVHPTWDELREALRGAPRGVYEPSVAGDAVLPFQTLIVGDHGLESRVKLPPRSSVLFRWVCDLPARRRIALVPVGHRCAIRMLLYKMEFDGPCFPFDLTRTERLSDVADIIASDFADMWNPELLWYDGEGGRLRHSRWGGLSFAHEVEEGDDPINNVGPVLQRMRNHYSARAHRFRHVCRSAGEVIFLRTGGASPGEVEDFVYKARALTAGRPFKLLLFSDQDDEFAGLEGVRHYRVDWNPDRMHDDPQYWTHCAGQLRHILEAQHGVGSRNLFWCPPRPAAKPASASACAAVVPAAGLQSAPSSAAAGA